MSIKRDALGRFAKHDTPTPVINTLKCHLCDNDAIYSGISVRNADGSLSCNNYCATCYRAIRDCDYCGHNSSDTTIIYGSRYCLYCLNTRYLKCPKCGCWNSSTRNACDSCGYIIIRPGVNNAGLKPKPEFKGKGPRYLGFELEVMNIDIPYSGSSAVVNSHADKLRADLDNRVYCKYDGSITGPGFEIVSHPATLRWYQNNINLFDPIFDLANDGYKSETTSCCGLHVHVSREALPSEVLYRMLRFVYSNPEWMQTIAQRGDGTYHTWNSYSEKNLIDKSQRHDGNRSAAINTTNTNTIEFRMFKGTLNKSHFWKGIETADALPAFAEAGYGVNETVGDFKDWLLTGAHAKRYANLNAFIAERGI